MFYINNWKCGLTSVVVVEGGWGRCVARRRVVLSHLSCILLWPPRRNQARPNKDKTIATRGLGLLLLVEY